MNVTDLMLKTKKLGDTIDVTELMLTHSFVRAPEIELWNVFLCKNSAHFNQLPRKNTQKKTSEKNNELINLRPAHDAKNGKFLAVLTDWNRFSRTK